MSYFIETVITGVCIFALAILFFISIFAVKSVLTENDYHYKTTAECIVVNEQLGASTESSAKYCKELNLEQK